MPKLFFVRDGSGNHKTSTGHSIPMEQAEALKIRFQTKYTETGPTINSGVASPFARYLHVVIEVESDERSAQFPQDGFYFVIGYSPDDAALDFGLNQD